MTLTQEQGKHSVEWLDRGREPQCPPNPSMPNGCAIDFVPFEMTGAPPTHPFGEALPVVRVATCAVELPYPAKRCGTYVIECGACGLRVACTTAGRPDDPRLARLPCQTLPGLPQ